MEIQPGDLKERRLWDDYQMAYADVTQQLHHRPTPWWIVPADRKWMRNLLLLETVVGALEKMNPKYPAAEFDPKDITID